MDEMTYLTILFDYYGDLFSDKQKSYFIDYYFNNLSLSEISENLNISRNAIHKQLKMMEKKLYEYEKVLGLYQKSQKLQTIIDKIKDNELKQQLLDLL
ncbi:MAG: YlxM family DNA-binding protein [Bacilli bacterium]|jgi:predicted DNA-binding protein YlxM (UPF0122 family)